MCRVIIVKLCCTLSIGPTLLCEPRELRQYDYLATGWTTVFRSPANRRISSTSFNMSLGDRPASYPVLVEVEVFTPRLKRFGRDANHSSFECRNEECMDLCLCFVIVFMIKCLNKKHRDILFNLNTSLLFKRANALIIHYEFQSSFAVHCNIVAFLCSWFWQQYVYKNDVLLCEERDSPSLLQQGVGHDLFVSACSGCPSDGPHLAVAKLCTRIIRCA
jgi:hypothetical protein